MLAVTSLSETNGTQELADLTAFVETHQIPHRFIRVSELAIPGYAENPANRCYFCKEALYKNLLSIAEQESYDAVFDGSNADDVADYRPGRKAAKEYGVHSPLLVAGLTKQDIRTLSQKWDLSTADKPSSPCLSSRIPYGDRITTRKIEQVREGENFLRGLGFWQLRVRHHGETARIEVEPKDFSSVLADRIRITQFFRKLGFTYVVLDLEGFRSGRLNESLPAEVLQKPVVSSSVEFHAVSPPLP